MGDGQFEVMTGEFGGTVGQIAGLRAGQPGGGKTVRAAE